MVRKNCPKLAGFPLMEPMAPKFNVAAKVKK